MSTDAPLWEADKDLKEGRNTEASDRAQVKENYSTLLKDCCHKCNEDDDWIDEEWSEDEEACCYDYDEEESDGCPFKEEPIIRFLKTDDNAILPKANNDDPGTGDSGYDVFSIANTVIPAKGSAIVPVGLKFAYITPGYFVRVAGRSGLSFKHNIIPHMGTIDNQYRGDCSILLYNFSSEDYVVKTGDKIAQLIVEYLLQPKIEWASKIQETERGSGGFGSTGR